MEGTQPADRHVRTAWTTFAASTALCMGLSIGSAAHAGATLDAVRDRGHVVCGVTEDLYGFSAPDSEGRWHGIDIDVCRAVAAAVLGDAEKVRYRPLNAQVRLTALQSGEIDILARNTTYTLTRDAAGGMNFTVVNFYDGQGFLVPKRLGVAHARELAGATICVQTGTTNELNVADFARAEKIEVKTLTFEKFAEAVAAYVAGRCDAFSADASGLAVIRAQSTPNPDDHVILPDIISREPLAPAVRQSDDQWYDIVKWSQYAMIEAEARGITSVNVDAMRDSPDPAIRRILGITPGLGAALGIEDAWAFTILKQVGNYGESFERNVGQGSKLKLPRGLNALWTDGGLMYPMPLR
jgi:ABC-type amino acid transport/signal transduction systems, periplasmic component/domain